MRATLSNYKQSPRKVRLVADMIRGKNVLAARDSLVFLAKKSSPDLQKLLESAIANARSMGMKPEDLIVQAISVNKGSVIRRFKPMARGRAAGIHRTMSHVTIELGAQSQSQNAKAKSQNGTPKSTKKKN